jgi:hypothetical protein
MALTYQKVTGTAVTIKNLAKHIADGLVATGKFAMVVDNSATDGFLIIRLTQSYKWKTASAAQLDNGIGWQGAGKTYRYEYPTTVGTNKENLYIKLKPLKDSNGKFRSVSIALSNQLNDAGTDFALVIQSNAPTQSPLASRYYLPDGTYQATAFTSNYHRRALSTVEGYISGTIVSNDNYFPEIRPFSAFVIDTTTVDYWLNVCCETIADDAQNGDRQDIVSGAVLGSGASGIPDVFMFGIPKSLSQFVSDSWGVARAIVCSATSERSTTGSYGGVLTLGYGSASYEYGMCPPNTVAVTANPYEHNQYTIYPQGCNGRYRTMSELAHTNSQMLNPVGIFQVDYSQSPNAQSFGLSVNFFRDFNDRNDSQSQMSPFVKLNPYILPNGAYYYAGGNTSYWSSTYYAGRPFLRVDGITFAWSPYSYITNWLNSSANTGDTVEFEGKRYLFIRYCGYTPSGTVWNYSGFMYLEDVV